MMNIVCLRTVFLSVLAAAATVPALRHAQAHWPDPPQHIVGHEKKPHARHILTMLPVPDAGKQKLLGKMDRIREILLATPALKNLRGYDWDTYDAIKDGYFDESPIRGYVGYIAFPYPIDPRREVVSSKEGHGFQIHINDIDVITNRHHNLDGEAKFMTEPRVVGQFAGFPVYEGRWIPLSRKPLFAPVTQERYIQRKIDLERAGLKKAKAIAKDIPDDPSGNQREIDGLAQAIRQARMEAEQRWAHMANNPGRVAHERQRFDAKERERLAELEMLRTTSARQRFLAPKQQRLQALEAELASLSPAERTADAYFQGGGAQLRPSGLLPIGQKNDSRIVTPNHELFDPRKPRSDIQLIMLGTTVSRPKIFDAVQDQLDIAGLVSLID